jgi:uncharacterized phage protein (TIGR02218 family)
LEEHQGRGSANGTFTETITSGVGTTIALEVDSNFEGDLDNVLCDEKVDVVWETSQSELLLGTITSVASNENFTDTGRVEADGYFNGGLITFTSGQNAGHSREIKTFASDTFQLGLPFPYAVAVSDTYEVYRGCDKTFETCRDVFLNGDNFRGEPLIPGIDEITKFGGQ